MEIRKRKSTNKKADYLYNDDLSDLSNESGNNSDDATTSEDEEVKEAEIKETGSDYSEHESNETLKGTKKRKKLTPKKFKPISKILPDGSERVLSTRSPKKRTRTSISKCIKFSIIL